METCGRGPGSRRSFGSTTAHGTDDDPAAAGRCGRHRRHGCHSESSHDVRTARPRSLRAWTPEDGCRPASRSSSGNGSRTSAGARRTERSASDRQHPLPHTVPTRAGSTPSTDGAGARTRAPTGRSRTEATRSLSRAVLRGPQVETAHTRGTMPERNRRDAGVGRASVLRALRGARASPQGQPGPTRHAGQFPVFPAPMAERAGPRWSRWPSLPAPPADSPLPHFAVLAGHGRWGRGASLTGVRVEETAELLGTAWPTISGKRLTTFNGVASLVRTGHRPAMGQP